MRRSAAFMIIICVAFLFGCSKKNEPVPSTSLQMLIVDNIANPIAGASVKLYASQTDWLHDTNPIGITQVSDVTGKVTFTNLQAIQYFWFAEKNCLNNINGGAETSYPIAANVINKLTSILTETGTLDFVNNSGDSYSVYINGVPIFTAHAGAEYTLVYEPTGAFTIRVLQLTGFTDTATDLTYTGTLTCGGVLSTAFPN